MAIIHMPDGTTFSEYPSEAYPEVLRYQVTVHLQRDLIDFGHVYVKNEADADAILACWQDNAGAHATYKKIVQVDHRR